MENVIQNGWWFPRTRLGKNIVEEAIDVERALVEYVQGVPVGIVTVEGNNKSQFKQRSI